MKTNKQWYPYKELGCYLKLDKNVLFACAMNGDGTKEDNPTEIEAWEWDDVGTGITMEGAIKELKQRE